MALDQCAVTGLLDALRFSGDLDVPPLLWVGVRRLGSAAAAEGDVVQLSRRRSRMMPTSRYSTPT